MKIGHVNLSEEVLLIAEIGNNHEGDFSLAERLINLAAEAGAQAVKFQTIDPTKLVSASEDERIKQLERFSFSPKQHEMLARIADKAGVMFMSTPFYLDAVEWLSDLVPAFKIASGDNDFLPLLQKVALTQKPVILSTGMIDYPAVHKAALEIRKIWKGNQVDPGLALLHCVSAYPADPKDANLGVIPLLRKYGDEVGYSDHTLGTEVALMSVAAGARIVEKHFTIDKHHSAFRDHQLSADPDELRYLSEQIKRVSEIFGSTQKVAQESEQSVETAARRSIVAAKDLPAGHILRFEDLAWLRPSGGISPLHTDRVIGSRLASAVKKGEQLSLKVIS